MNAREEILARVREALKRPAPRRRPHGTGEGSNGAAPAEGPRSWLPRVGASFDERVALFAENAAGLRAEFEMLDAPDAFRERLSRLAAECGWKRVAAHRGELTGAALEGLGAPVLWVDDGYRLADLEPCDAGVTECDALVAQTGSVVLTARSGGGRALSALAPHHVVLARREQLVPDLPSAFEVLEGRYGREYPSFMTIISGPSRTGDIERILVLGVHGPKRLTILCG